MCEISPFPSRKKKEGKKGLHTGFESRSRVCFSSRHFPFALARYSHRQDLWFYRVMGHLNYLFINFRVQRCRNKGLQQHFLVSIVKVASEFLSRNCLITLSELSPCYKPRNQLFYKALKAINFSQ